jgi:hypothetical protein
MYHHVKKLMYTVKIDDPIRASVECYSSNLEAQMASLLLRCSIPSKE